MPLSGANSRKLLAGGTLVGLACLNESMTDSVAVSTVAPWKFLIDSCVLEHQVPEAWTVDSCRKGEGGSIAVGRIYSAAAQQTQHSAPLDGRAAREASLSCRAGTGFCFFSKWAASHCLFPGARPLLLSRAVDLFPVLHPCDLQLCQRSLPE